MEFICPSCKASHSRGPVNGVDRFRCLRCGFVGAPVLGEDYDAAISAALRVGGLQAALELVQAMMAQIVEAASKME